jgi:two-component system NarL family sensor kinase
LTESIDLAERSMTGVRTLSYLLHPPFLDEIGLVSALRWYAEGFAQRSGIAVDLDLPSSFERLDQDVETALFRIVQEALINVHLAELRAIAEVLERSMWQAVVDAVRAHAGLGLGLTADQARQARSKAKVGRAFEV